MGSGDTGTDRVTCSVCGRIRGTGDSAEALAWMSERVADGGGAAGLRWLCPDCAREHARDIEGRLPREYW